MIAPPVPPTSVPRTRPVAVEPVAAPIKPPTAPPDAAPMTAPFVWWLVDAHPYVEATVAIAATSKAERFMYDLLTWDRAETADTRPARSGCAGDAERTPTCHRR